MREILFRGKSFDTGEWVEGGLIQVMDEHKGSVCAIIPVNVESYRFCMSGTYIDPSSIGQFTGLKDKNGKKIFEGDILKDVDAFYNSKRVLIVYDDSSFQYRELPLASYFVGSPIDDNEFGISNIDDDYEIIGNIHDNPELLETKNHGS